MNETGLKQATKHLFYPKHQTPEAKHRRGKERERTTRRKVKRHLQNLEHTRMESSPMQASPSLASSFLSFVCVGVGVGAKCGTKRKCGNRYARWQATRQNSEASPGGRVDRTASRHPKAGACCPGLRGLLPSCRSLSPPKGDTASPLQRGVGDTRRTPHHILQQA